MKTKKEIEKMLIGRTLSNTEFIDILKELFVHIELSSPEKKEEVEGLTGGLTSSKQWVDKKLMVLKCLNCKWVFKSDYAYCPKCGNINNDNFSQMAYDMEVSATKEEPTQELEETNVFIGKGDTSSTTGVDMDTAKRVVIDHSKEFTKEELLDIQDIYAREAERNGREFGVKSKAYLFCKNILSKIERLLK